LEKKVADQEATIKLQAEQLNRLQNAVEHVVRKFDELINIESDKTFAAALDDLYYGIRSPDKYLWLTEDAEQDNGSIVTYTDMPSLVDQSDLIVLNPDYMSDNMSVSTHDSMPPLLHPSDLNEEDSDDSAQARINFSRDLCDNS
jgi:hypothetical protein